jgi:predicted metalloendopeptidase
MAGIAADEDPGQRADEEPGQSNKGQGSTHPTNEELEGLDCDIKIEINDCACGEVDDSNDGESNDEKLSGNTADFPVRSPSPPITDLQDREVIFAMCFLLLLSTSLGCLLFMGASKAMDMARAREAVWIASENERLGVDECGRPLTNICETKECLYMAASMLENMNTSANPCEDFWNYACGGWLAKHNIPASRTSWSVDTEIEKRLNLVIKDLIEAPVERNTDISAERKVKTLYIKCMDVDQIDEKGHEEISKVIKSLGGWAATENWGREQPRFSFQHALEEMHFTYWTDVFFTFWVTTDDKSSDKSILQFDQSGLGMPHYSYYFLNDTNPIVQGYKQYMTDIAKYFNVTAYKISDFVSSTYEFEKKLANITIPDDHMGRMHPELLYNPMTIKDLQKLAPAINWLRFIHHNFSHVDSSTIVLLTQKEYFANISRIISNTDAKVLNYYMIWRLISNYARELSKPFRNAVHKFDSVQKGTAHKLARSRYCLNMLDDWMGMAVGSMFIKKNFPPENKDEVTEMIETLKETFEKRLNNNSWMDPETKKAALDKLKNVNHKIGYPDFIIDTSLVDKYFSKFHIDDEQSFFQMQMSGIQYEVAKMIENLKSKTDKSDDWGMNPHQVNAYYSPTENLMVFPAGILQRPYYNEKTPRYINFGGIGATIGHELIHGFDVFGSRYDTSGNLGEWWSPKATKAFTNRTKCVEDFYSNFTINGTPVDGQMTLGENIADIGGTTLAYQAYKYWESKQGEGFAEARLPGKQLEKLGNDHLFFLAFGQNWCMKRSPANVQDMLRGNSHAPEEVRVKGTLSQMTEFAEVFKCREEDAMSADEKCYVY